MLKAKIALILNYFIIALLLNSVNVFVIQLSNQLHAAEGTISAFAPVKDFTILVASFLLASFIPRLGPRKSITLGLIAIIIACIAMGIHPAISTSFLFFILLGISFSLIKVATYASVIQITDSPKAHTSFVSLLEGCFMAGILSMSWLFGIFEGFGHWTYVFWIMAAVTVFALIFYLTSSINLNADETTLNKNSNRFDLAILKTLFSSQVMWFFIILTVCYVFIENGLTIWLPTFDNHFLHINAAISIELLSIFSASLAIGRLIFSAILKYLNTAKTLVVSMVLGLLVFGYSIIMIASMPSTASAASTWGTLPTVAYWLPLVGFVIAPIYPTFCSVLLTHFPQHRFQSPISSMIVIFSAVGGMAGASLLGYTFKLLGPAKGIAIPAIPLLIILLLTIPFFALIKRRSKQTPT